MPRTTEKNDIGWITKRLRDLVGYEVPDPSAGSTTIYRLLVHHTAPTENNGYQGPAGLVTTFSKSQDDQPLLVVKWAGGSYWKGRGEQGYDPARYTVYQVFRVRVEDRPSAPVELRVIQLLDWPAAGPSLSRLTQ